MMDMDETVSNVAFRWSWHEVGISLLPYKHNLKPTKHQHYIEHGPDGVFLLIRHHNLN